MNHIHKTANRYYMEFESYEGVIHLKSPWIYLFLVSVCGMVFCMLGFTALLPDDWQILCKDNFILSTFVFEVIALATWTVIQTKKENRAIARAQRQLRSSSDSLKELKSEWFQQTLDINNTEYLSLASDLDKYLELKERHRPILNLTSKQIFDLLISADSKNRILAIFMGLCAATIALCIAAETNIYTIFEILESENLYFFFFMVFLVSVLLLGFYLVLRYTTLLAYIFFENATGKIDGLNNTSKRRVQILINQLLQLHVIKRGKVKVNSV